MNTAEINRNESVVTKATFTFKLKRVLNNVFGNTFKYEIDEALKYSEALNVKIKSSGIKINIESLLKNEEITKQAESIGELKNSK